MGDVFLSPISTAQPFGFRTAPLRGCAAVRSFYPYALYIPVAQLREQSQKLPELTYVQGLRTVF